MEIIIGMFVLMLLVLVAGIWMVREAFVKPFRCHKWYKQYGYRIGSDEFYEWCSETGVPVSYFL